MRTLAIIALVAFSIGCSHTLYKREKDPSKPLDQGSETSIHLRGPKAVVKHTF